MLDGGLIADDRSIVDQNIEGTALETALDSCEERVDVPRDAELRAYCEGATTVSLDARQRRVRRGVVAAIVNKDERPVSGEPPRNRGANAARTARNQCRFIDQ